MLCFAMFCYAMLCYVMFMIAAPNSQTEIANFIVRMSRLEIRPAIDDNYFRPAIDGNYYTVNDFVSFHGQDLGIWNWIAGAAFMDEEFSFVTGDDPSANTRPDRWYALDERRKALDNRWWTYSQFIQYYGNEIGNLNWYAAGRFWAACGYVSQPPLGWFFLQFCKGCNRDLTRSVVPLAYCDRCNVQVCAYCIVNDDGPYFCPPCIDWIHR